MPFDNPDIRVEIANPHADALEVVDKMAWILAKPENWGKGMLRWYNSYCLVGALVTVEGQAIRNRQRHQKARTSAGRQVLCKLTELCGYDDIMEFNDARETKHPDVVSLIQRTRASFE